MCKSRSSQKIDSQIIFSREYDFPKTFSLAENQFSGKTYFYTIASRNAAASHAVPTFDLSESGDVTAVLHKPALLNCRVKSIGNKTVSGKD